jgi:hypothetical protein
MSLLDSPLVVIVLAAAARWALSRSRRPLLPRDELPAQSLDSDQHSAIRSDRRIAPKPA